MARGKAVSHITSNSVIEFLSDLFSRWGLPSEILTDNGRKFVSREFKMFLKKLGIKHDKTAFYDPQSNGALNVSIEC